MSVKTTDEPDVAATQEHQTAARRVTFEEYLTLGDERTMSEWVNGGSSTYRR